MKPASDALAIRAAFLARLEEPVTAEALFDRLTDLVFFVKNERGEYVVVNQTLAERCGRRRKDELVGRRADELFPAPLGEGYRDQDLAVLGTGATILDQLELHLYPTGRRGWCLTTKLPLKDRSGRIIGLMGLSKDLQSPDERDEGYSAVAAALKFLHNNLAETVRVKELAALARQSPYQFERRIRRIFRLTTGQLIQKTRIERALRLLRETTHPVARVAQDCGYADQSAFTRTFRRMVGMTPTSFRESAPARP